MPLQNLARDMYQDAVIGGVSFTKFNNASAHIGVGNGTTLHDPTQTDLQGASKARKAMDAGYPSIAANVVTYRSTFGTSEGNFAWEEIGVFNAASAGEMLFRQVTSQGTKTSAAAWQVTLQHTLLIA